MSLRDRVQSAQRDPGFACSIALIQDQLSGSDRAELDTVLADRALSAAAIARVLTAEGHVVRQQTVARHRRGDCSCGTR